MGTRTAKRERSGDAAIQQVPTSSQQPKSAPPSQPIIAARQVSVESYYDGPIPHPDHLIRYREALPSAPERILAMAEKQQAHRIEMERTALLSEIELAKRGQTFGVIAVVVTNIMVVALGYMGLEIAASIIGVGELATLAGAFFYGTQSRRKERIYKAEKMAKSLEKGLRKKQ